MCPLYRTRQRSREEKTLKSFLDAPIDKWIESSYEASGTNRQVDRRQTDRQATGRLQAKQKASLQTDRLTDRQTDKTQTTSRLTDRKRQINGTTCLNTLSRCNCLVVLQVDNPLYLALLSLFVYSLEQWNQNRVAFLKRLIVTAHARHTSPAGSTR